MVQKQSRFCTFLYHVFSCTKLLCTALFCCNASLAFYDIVQMLEQWCSAYEASSTLLALCAHQTADIKYISQQALKKTSTSIQVLYHS